jgi:hypothetical protein
VAFDPSGGVLAVVGQADESLSVFAPSGSTQAAAWVTYTTRVAPAPPSSKPLAIQTAVRR